MEIRALEKEKDLDEVLELLALSLTNPGDKDWYYWKHVENPFGESPGFVAVDEGKVVGVRLFLRWNLNYNGKKIKALRPVDTATHPDARGKGIFKKLTLHGLSVANADNTHLIFNTPNSNSLPGYLKMGWQQLHEPIPHSYFLVNHFRTCLQVRQHNNFDSFQFASTDSSSFVETEKTQEFYKWRYKDKRYEIASLVDNHNTFIVYQMLKVKGVRVLSVTDFYGDAALFQILIRSLAKKLNVYICHCLEYPTVFSTAGITKVKRGSSLVVYKGPTVYLESPWKFSPGDLEGVL
ncbi:GNAT family N-acetyltransferase [Pontibacter pamirensis]|uniref:GNAT family N-acetyltransferase n=1 Tax=Pontibacter pamirensis TaxID=2562824 RepID=UPI001389F8D9|nr:GNAT family N-acetyltransferase [Pontibacter pamirensis]